MQGRQRRAETKLAVGAKTPGSSGVNWLLMVTIVTTLLPMQFYVGPLFMTPSRVLFLFLTPALLIGLLSGRFGTLNVLDGLVLFNVTWMVISVFINNPEVAVNYTGSNAIVILGGYLVGRSTIRNPDDFKRLAKYLAVAVIISFPFALAETVTGKMYVARFMDSLPGIRGVADVLYRPRLGFQRVQFVFAHPIHYGLFCSMAASLVYIGLQGVIGKTSRLIVTSIILVCCFLSVSSGPFLSIMVQVFLIGWMMALHGIKRKWIILLWAIFILYLILEVISTRPAIYAIVSMLAFAPHTANVRRILFEYGIAQIGERPVLGVGFNPWDRPMPDFMSGSIDNFWLLLALVYGLPSFFALFTGIVYSIIRISKCPTEVGSAFDNSRHAWIFTIISLTLTLATVAIWNEIMSMFYLMLGAGSWMIAGDIKPDPINAVDDKTLKSRGVAFTRFPRVQREN